MRKGWGRWPLRRCLSLSYHTVKRYLQAPAFPERKPRTTRCGDLLDPYKPYLLRRWSEGCRNGLQLFREIHARGYASSRANVARFVTHLRRSEPAAPAPARPAPALLLPRVRPPGPAPPRRAVSASP